MLCISLLSRIFSDHQSWLSTCPEQSWAVLSSPVWLQFSLYFSIKTCLFQKFPSMYFPLFSLFKNCISVFSQSSLTSIFRLRTRWQTHQKTKMKKRTSARDVALAVALHVGCCTVWYCFYSMYACLWHKKVTVGFPHEVLSCRSRRRVRAKCILASASGLVSVCKSPSSFVSKRGKRESVPAVATHTCL